MLKAKAAAAGEKGILLFPAAAAKPTKKKMAKHAAP